MRYPPAGLGCREVGRIDGNYRAVRVAIDMVGRALHLIRDARVEKCPDSTAGRWAYGAAVGRPGKIDGAAGTAIQCISVTYTLSRPLNGQRCCLRVVSVCIDQGQPVSLGAGRDMMHQIPMPSGSY